MKILVVADQESRSLWDFYRPEKLSGIDLISSCGDLNPNYLQFLVTCARCPLLYVHGNHDSVYEQTPPYGCISIDGSIYDFKGLRILGLGGSRRYKPGECMYTEREMRRRIFRLLPSILWHGGFDVLVSHAPAAGWGDLDDLPHRGFRCFNKLLNRFKPAYMLHGHVHLNYGHFQRQLVHSSGTILVNGWESCLLDLPDDCHPEQGKTGSPLYDLYLRLRPHREAAIYEKITYL